MRQKLHRKFTRSRSAATSQNAAESNREDENSLEINLEQEIEDLLADLADTGLQSDARYVDIAIRSRIRKGYGPHFIERELRSKGVGSDLIQSSEEWQAADWLSLAFDLKERRFPDIDPETRREAPKLWQKAVRTFQQRGFSSSHIAQVLNP